MVDICLLGCGGMIPLPNRWLTSLLVRYNGKMILIDCGEGNQIPVRMTGWGFKSIDAILLTHYHADHIAGLPGFLLTLMNSMRVEPLIIAGPPGLYRIMEGVRILAPDVKFNIQLIELSENHISDLQVGDFYIKSIPVYHTDLCLGYSININRLPKFDINKAKGNNVPVKLWQALHNGLTIKENDIEYRPSLVLGKKRKGLKISYSTDTRPTRGFVDFAKNSDLMICEGMYGDRDKIGKAQKNRHMMFYEAAQMALEANVKKLWLTHFSPSLSDPKLFIEETRNIFKETELGDNLKMMVLNYEKDV